MKKSVSELVIACKFLQAQVRQLASMYMSEESAEWLAKNDAMCCADRAIAQFEGTPQKPLDDHKAGE